MTATRVDLGIRSVVRKRATKYQASRYFAGQRVRAPPDRAESERIVEDRLRELEGPVAVPGDGATPAG